MNMIMKLKLIFAFQIYHYLMYFANTAYPQPQCLWPPEQLKAFHLACYTLEMCMLDSGLSKK